MQVVQCARKDMQPDSGLHKNAQMCFTAMHMPMQWILYTAQQRRKHKQYEAARLDGMCVTLRPGTMVVKKHTHTVFSFWYLKL